MKREALNHLFCLGLRQLDYVTATYATYHNEFRPHQGLDNRPPSQRDHPPPDAGKAVHGRIRRQTWLGGLLSHYYRQAA
jgi:hypothetical protein